MLETTARCSGGGSGFVSIGRKSRAKLLYVQLLYVLTTVHRPCLLPPFGKVSATTKGLMPSDSGESNESKARGLGEPAVVAFEKVLNVRRQHKRKQARRDKLRLPTVEWRWEGETHQRLSAVEFIKWASLESRHLNRWCNGRLGGGGVVGGANICCQYNTFSMHHSNVGDGRSIGLRVKSVLLVAFANVLFTIRPDDL